MSRLLPDSALAICTVWAEARGEIYDGKVAVAEVIRNRMKEKRLSATWVVLKPLQFSCWNSHDHNRIPMAEIDDADPVVQQCIAAWNQSETSNLTNGANHYWNPKIVTPSWSVGAETIAIGSHLFARL